jgi:hypothetical protein
MDCPACSASLTVEVSSSNSFSNSLSDVILAADEGECLTVVQDCWQCGWHEDREVRIEQIDVTDGDSRAVDRAALVSEIQEELDGIERLDTLEQALAEIKRHRRLEDASGTDGTTTDGH